MYYPMQIVYDLTDKKVIQITEDVWDLANYQHRTSHFIALKAGTWDKYEIYLPASIAEAEDLLNKGIISPAPFNWETHCWKCHNWYSNHKPNGECHKVKD